MEREIFEQIVERVFHELPDIFKSSIDNVNIVVEDYPNDEIIKKMRLRSKHQLLGLYQGIPRIIRGSAYGMTAIAPDLISLYQKNIEHQCRSEKEIEEKIHEVLIHEIGHYFGMSEEEIREAGY